MIPQAQITDLVVSPQEHAITFRETVFYGALQLFVIIGLHYIIGWALQSREPAGARPLDGLVSAASTANHQSATGRYNGGVVRSRNRTQQRATSIRPRGRQLETRRHSRSYPDLIPMETIEEELYTE